MGDISQRLSRVNGKTLYLGVELPPGPWDHEPDHVDFKAEGFPCILHRGPMGAWCGYVGVPPGHPWHGKDCNDVRVPQRDPDDVYSSWPDVHGGLTYSEPCQGAVCHVAKPGEPDDVWWLGFDCNHGGDSSLSDEYFALTQPALFGRRDYSQYRTVEYVRRETESLARQAKEVA